MGTQEFYRNVRLDVTTQFVNTSHHVYVTKTVYDPTTKTLLVYGHDNQLIETHTNVTSAVAEYRESRLLA
jgi:hypothetical protein